MVSQLAHLATKSSISCDTLDPTIARTHGPFTDCTSNQAITLSALVAFPAVLFKAARLAPTLPFASTVSLPALTAELATCLLSTEFLPHLTGRIHTQTNPTFAFSTASTISCARRIVAIYASLGAPKERICIKIPATWEGLLACEALEKEGIATLATTLFTMQQAMRAGRVGCTYVAPYVNALRVHFGGAVELGGEEVVVRAQRWFERVGVRTEVLAASFVGAGEVMGLMGTKHLTISTGLLEELGAMVWDGVEGVGVWGKVEEVEEVEADGEAEWRLAVNREGGGKGAMRLVDAINIFCDIQEKLEVLCAEALEKVQPEGMQA